MSPSDLHSFLHDALPIFFYENSVSASSSLPVFMDPGLGPAGRPGMTTTYPASAAMMRAHERVPLWNEVRSYFSLDRKSTRLNSSHSQISYAVFCLKKK